MLGSITLAAGNIAQEDYSSAGPEILILRFAGEE
jgi:hypothetical protein